MNHRTVVIGSSTFAVALVLLSARSASSRPALPAFIALQPNSAGNQQFGNMNIDGIGLFGKIGINTQIPSSKLHVLGDATVEWGFTGPAIFGSNNAMSGFTVGVMGAANGQSGTGVYGIALAEGGSTYGVYGNAVASLNGVGVRGEGSGLGIWARAGFADGTALLAEEYASNGYSVGVKSLVFSPDGVGLFSTNQAATGPGVGAYGETYSGDGTAVLGFNRGTTGNGYGVVGKSDSSSGVAVFGQTNSTTGQTAAVSGLSLSTNGFGVAGKSSNPSGVNYGVRGESYSNQGTGLLGVASATIGVTYGAQGVSAGSSGVGVLGLAQHFTGANTGVKGQSNSSAGTGVFGFAGATSGVTVGVQGNSDSPNGFGLYGLTTALTGPGTGVYGESKSAAGGGVVGIAPAYGTVGYAGGLTGIALYGYSLATSGLNYGLYSTLNSGAGYAGYFQGRVHVNAALSKLGGSFMIDHPMDPQNKFLVHSFVESPDMMNVYNGEVRTNEKGEAWAELPSYFEVENRTFRYQLTVVEDENTDGFCMVKVAKKIHGNRFLIRSSVPNAEVCWQVTGIRQDPWAEAHRIVPEPAKNEFERGKYLTPELYGQPKEMGIHYRPEPELMRSRSSSRLP